MVLTTVPREIAQERMVQLVAAINLVCALFLSGMTQVALEPIEIEELPPAIGHLTALKDLMLRENKLNDRTIPEELGLCKQLQLIVLANNKLDVIPWKQPPWWPKCLSFFDD